MPLKASAAIDKRSTLHWRNDVLRCNFCRIHKTLRTSPVQAAGVTDELVSMESLCAIMDAASPPKKRGPYKKAAQ